MALREKVTEAMLLRYPIPADKVFDQKHPYHYKDFKDNLFGSMDNQTMQSYGNGSGGEMESTDQSPAKMASIASSSAMTYNLLGNGPIEIAGNDDFPSGNYQLQYEKQMYTLNMGSKPANLDAFLSDEDARTSVFCEMKLLEWLGKPGILKDSYRNPQYYFSADPAAVSCPVDAFSVFQELIDAITAANFQRYDAWQMFKHLLAIYNYTSYTTRTAVEEFRGVPSMAGQYNRILLVNIVNEFPPECILDTKAQVEYIAALYEEQREAADLITLLQKSDIPRLFDNNCNAGIDVQYMSAKDFAAGVVMPQAKKEYLKRYFA
jgi:hypothetical protein